MIEDRHENRDKLLLESLEVSAAYHCSLTCRGCSHASPLETSVLPDHEELILSIRTLEKYLHCRVLRILGGEPTLDPQLCSLICNLRESGIADQISIATNGLDLEKVNEAAAFADWIELSNYHYSKSYSEQIERWAQEAADRYEVRISIYYFDTFREPFALIPHGDPCMVHKIYEACIIAHKWQCWNIRDNWLFKCPQAAVVSRYISHHPFSDDGVRIVDDGMLQERLIVYFNCKDPLNACQYCLGSCGKRFTIGQCTHSWLSYQAHPALELLDEPFLRECLSFDIRDMRTVGRIGEFIPFGR